MAGLSLNNWILQSHLNPKIFVLLYLQPLLHSYVFVLVLFNSPLAPLLILFLLHTFLGTDYSHLNKKCSQH